MKILSLAFVVFCLSAVALAQDASNTAIPIQPSQTCLSYRFQPGDSLIYRLVSYDSVYFKENEPLMKERMERIELVCDSIDRNGRFYVRQTLKDYIARESMGDIKGRVRTESPWIGRTVFVVIDSMGNRFIDSLERPAPSAMSPGGAFQPPLLIGLNDSCAHPNSSWMVDRVRELVPEAGFPAPVRVQSTLYERLPSADTLGFVCQRVLYTLTGQGSIVAMDQKPPMRVAAVLAGGGNMLLSEQYRVPVHLQAGTQIKMDITTADKKLVKGTQYTHSFYTLEEFYRNGKPVTTNAPADEPTKPKKNGKSGAPRKKTETK